jgi:hypothetical protein
MEAARTSETSVDNYSSLMMEAARTSETSVDNCSSLMMEVARTSETSVDNYSSLIMEAARTSETSVDNYFTRQYIPEYNSELQNCNKYVGSVRSSEIKADQFFDVSLYSRY